MATQLNPFLVIWPRKFIIIMYPYDVRNILGSCGVIIRNNFLSIIVPIGQRISVEPALSPTCVLRRKVVSASSTASPDEQLAGTCLCIIPVSVNFVSHTFSISRLQEWPAHSCRIKWCFSNIPAFIYLSTV